MKICFNVNRVVPCGQTDRQTDRQTDTMNLIVIFCNFRTRLKTRTWILKTQICNRFRQRLKTSSEHSVRCYALHVGYLLN